MRHPWVSCDTADVTTVGRGGNGRGEDAALRARRGARSRETGVSFKCVVNIRRRERSR